MTDIIYIIHVNKKNSNTKRQTCDDYLMLQDLMQIINHTLNKIIPYFKKSTNKR